MPNNENKIQPVRFSIVAGPHQRPDLGQSASEAWKLYVEDAIFAEELGFDFAFIGEHHFSFARSNGAVMLAGNSAPLVMLAEIAARTERIRVGTSLLALPFHNPVRVAEDIAGVDIVSGGRFELGVGVGSQWEPFETFGIAPKERFGRTWEALDVIERCFGGEEEFTHEGKYFHFPKVRWIIPPVQKRLPVWWGGQGPQGVRRAAKRGYNLMSPDVSGAYCETLRSLGRRPEDHLIGFSTFVSVAPTKEEAFDAIVDSSLYANNVYATRRNLDGTWPPESNRLSIEQLREANYRTTQVALFTPVADTVEGVIERFLPLARGVLGPMNHFGIEFRPAGTKTAHVRRSMELFAKEVMPVIRDEATKFMAGLSPTD